MAEFKLGRIRFVWKGDWTASTAYVKDDVVKFGGKTFICQVGHTSDSNFYTDLSFVPTKWNQMADGQDWKGDWATSTYYKVNDLVKYGGLIYICTTAHNSASTVSGGLEANLGSWQVFAEGLDWKGDWTTTTRYKINDVVKYGGYTYVCNLGHTSAASATLGLEADSAKWDTFNQGIDYRGAWTGPGTRYKVNDTVKYGGGLWIATVAHSSSSSFSSDSANWAQFVEGFEFEDSWSSVTTYQPGDIVRYGGNQYVSKTIHSNKVPTVETSDWDLFSQGFKFTSDWSYSTSYKIGEVVRFNGYTYLATADVTPLSLTITNTSSSNNQFTTSNTSALVVNQAVKFSGTTFGNVSDSATYYVKTIDGATVFTISTMPGGTVFTPTTAAGSMTAEFTTIPPNTSSWQRLNSGINWRGVWVDDVEYQLGDVVRYGDNAYICVLTHRSEGDDGSTVGAQGGGAANSRPDLDLSGTYWNAFVIGNETAVLTARGDLVYYGGAGPTRLPVGIEGQILSAGAQDPEWKTLGRVDYVWHVGPHGQDHPPPIHGTSVDKPFKTIRYACEWVEKGARNLNAKKLLEMNRVFIQREVTEWIQYQIANSLAPFTPSFVYDDYKCERDTGLIIDALIYDISHGGNVKTRGAANALVNALLDSPGTYSRLAAEKDEDIAAWTYMLEVVEAVLNNEAPAVNYQTTNGDNSTAVVGQWIDTAYTAETGVMNTITSLVGIITQALQEESADNIPARYVPSNLIRVATGQYREVLPIIVPEMTCVLGDELRSTHAGPRVGETPRDDVKYSMESLGRLEAIVGDIVKGVNVTETVGNPESQSQLFPFADTAQADDLEKLVRVMQYNIDFRTSQTNMITFTDPTNYNTSYLVGYGDARKLVKENKRFLQEEVRAYLIATYPTLKYSKTTCIRDVGYIIDAIVYDLTYGGNSQTINAALAYYEGVGSSLYIDSTEITATAAAYTFLKGRMQTVANATGFTALNTEVTQFFDTAGSAGAITHIGNLLDIIINVISTGLSSLPSVTITGVSSNTFTTSSAHNLAVGDTVTPRTASVPAGIVANKIYYVKSVPAGNQFTLSETWDGTTATFTNTAGLSIIANVVDNPATAWVSGTYSTAFTNFSAQLSTIKTDTINYINSTYSGFTYDQDKCARDIGIILDAVGYDMMFDSNYQSLKAGYSYLRQTASEVFSLGQKTITRDALDYVKTEVLSYAGADPTVISRINALMLAIDDIIYSGSNEGSRCASENRLVDYAYHQLERNRDFIVNEIDTWIDSTYTTTITATTATTDILTASSTAWMQRNAAIRFTGTTFGGVQTNTTYYIQNVLSSTQFKVSESRNGSPLTLSTASGSMTAKLHYNSELCLRDVNSYLDALKYDIKYPGNYKSLLAARYYGNSVMGSLEEDMYYLRDGTGVRDMTLEGLSGDLLPANEYGTSRVSAGAYCSLDPGWGPEDYRTWIITRSPYVQGVTTFGTGAIGQKIDGALHNGGNDSIVSNDFTQVISDGIGAWVANNGRAELVSVFTYYAHIGYLATEGGRIRGTNGNNSYGDFGSVAEGFDATEIPGTAIVDNRQQYVATVSSIYTDGNNLLQYEFENAGNDYTFATWTVTGGGLGANVVQDEFRDDGVFEVRMLDLGNDSSGQFGGINYLTNANTAQGGSSTSITIAATDSEISSAYVGMKIYLTAGTGVGQYGIISAYNSGTKVASVIKESTGAAGWDHLVPGTTISSPDASTTYVIEPRIEFSHPGFDSAVSTGLTSGTYVNAAYGKVCAIYGPLTGTYSGSGVGATFTITRNGYKYLISLTTAGTGYERLETITIPGTSLGGLTPTNDLVITVTSINSVTGAITAFDQSGYGRDGRFVALRSDSGNTGVYSDDGLTWASMTLPTTGSWSAVTAGVFDDGSSIARISRFVAVRTGSNKAAWSADGITWNDATLPTSAAWTSVAFGNGKFVAIASDSTTVAISNDGEIWDITGALATTGYVDVTYGKGMFAAVRSGTNVASTSTDGVTWTTRTLPATTNWNSVTWGNNRFVAISTNSNSGAYSLDGTTWTAMTVGSADGSSVAGYQQVHYAQGVFMATAYQSGVEDYSFVATSEDGIVWTVRGVVADAGAMSGYNAIAFGSPQRTGYWAIIPYASTTEARRIRTGARARARAFVADTKIFAIRLHEPGSGYTSDPVMTITDPNNTYEAPTDVRVGKGVLANPTFVSRGSSFNTGSAEIFKEDSDGVADFLQSGTFVAVRRLSRRPVAGSNVVFADIPGQTFKLVNILTFRGELDGSYTAFFQVSPEVLNSQAPSDGSAVETRIRYSQVRLTGHDFLDIGTGNFAETNYPGLPTQDPNPANETQEGNGGRVFYTSTDQDGNFRVGGLFNVEQSTGIATLNADAFNLAGLQELSLGDLTLGGGSASINEFSTDPFFTADSDNIVPTQRAIKAYIASQIGGGGASLNVNSVTAGFIFINSNQITTTTGGVIQMRAKFEFRGGVTGLPLAFNFFLQ